MRNFYLAVTCVCVYILSSLRLLLTEQNKCNARDQASDAVLSKYFCVKNLCCHVLGNHSRDLQARNCAKESVKPGRATRSKRQLLKLSKTNGKSAKHSYLPPHQPRKLFSLSTRINISKLHYTERFTLTREGLSNLA